MILASFLGFLALVLVLGAASAFRSRRTTADYFLASRAVHPALVGLSAVATNNSGYMFIGVIGFTYASGLSAIWLMIGWIVGDLIGSLLVHRQLREATERSNQITFAGVLSRWGGPDGGSSEQRIIRIAAALFSIVFLGAYAGAQFSAGGKALHAIFGWHQHSGALMVAVVVAVYCLAGGIRASIWTDAMQATIMLIAMSVLLFAADAKLGGIDPAIQQLSEIPGYLNWFPSDLLIPGVTGMTLFVIGWLFAGISVIGQPHIMIRFMSIDDPSRLTQARWWYYSFFTIFYGMATVVGLLSRILLPDLSALDPEMALPQMAQLLLPPIFVGLILAGIFSATMSTADSLVLSCSAAISQDLAPSRLHSLLFSKLATLAVAALALVIAMTGPTSVFVLVILAWSMLASAFVPLVLVYAFGARLTQSWALAMMLIGPSVAMVWRAFDLHSHIYEGMPGILAGLLVFGVSRALTKTSPTHAVKYAPTSR
jgi:sodium/proline symporter